MRTSTKVASLIGGSALALALSTVSASAAAMPNIQPSASDISGFDLASFFQNGVQTAVNVVFFLAMGASIGYLVWAGIKYITAGGDAKKAEGARTAIINAVIGIAVIAGAYTLINVAFGINNTVNDVASTPQDFSAE